MWPGTTLCRPLALHGAVVIYWLCRSSSEICTVCTNILLKQIKFFLDRRVPAGVCKNSYYLGLKSDLSLLHGSIRHRQNSDCDAIAPTDSAPTAEMVILDQ